MLNQFAIMAAAIVYGALILGADLLLDTGDVIAIAYLGMAFPCLWLKVAPGPIFCALIGAAFIAIGGGFGAGVSENAALTLAARGGSIVALLGAGLLAAGRIKSDEALHLAVERFTDVLEVSADWIWETDADHRFTFVSQRYYDITGVRPADVIGQNRAMLLRRNIKEDEKHASNNEAIEDHLGDVSEQRAFQAFSYWSETPVGRRCYWISGKPLFDGAGRFKGYRGAGRDVTAQALIALELEAANEAKSEFLRTMSHELRTPLNAVIGFSEVISDELFGPVGNRKYLEYAKDIEQSGRHLLDMINDILDISRIESGRLDLAEERVTLAEVIDQTAHIMEERARRAGVRLEKDAPPGLPDVRADRRAMVQVLLNLVSNAVKFTPRGGRVRIRAAMTADGGVRLSVADNGVGIPAAEIDKLMKPFAQASNKAVTGENGTGLGLYLVKRLVEAHGGCFQLESEDGKGVLATIALPPKRLISPIAHLPEAV